MLYLSIYRFPPENRKAVIARFMETGGKPQPGVKLLGRWNDVAGGRGFTVTESDDPVAASKYIQEWSDLMSFEVIPVLTDEQMVKVLGG